MFKHRAVPLYLDANIQTHGPFCQVIVFRIRVRQLRAGQNRTGIGRISASTYATGSADIGEGCGGAQLTEALANGVLTSERQPIVCG